MEVRGVTPERLEEVEDNTVVDGTIDGSGNLKLITHGGAQKNAGKVIVPLAAWPIGSIYIGTTSTDPKVLLGGGEWERFAKGRVLVGVDENDSAFNGPNVSGGAKTHTLTVAEMPSHAHGASSGNDSPDHSHVYYRESFTNIAYAPGGSGALVAQGSSYAPSTEGASARHTHAITVNPNGGGGAHNNLQPYIAVYMWRRAS